MHRKKTGGSRRASAGIRLARHVIRMAERVGLGRRAVGLLVDAGLVLGMVRGV